MARRKDQRVEDPLVLVFVDDGGNVEVNLSTTDLATTAEAIAWAVRHFAYAANIPVEAVLESFVAAVRAMEADPDMAIDVEAMKGTH